MTPRADVHWVVTEFGSVNLYGKSLQERAKLLISNAHPDDRRALNSPHLSGRFPLDVNLKFNASSTHEAQMLNCSLNSMDIVFSFFKELVFISFWSIVK